MGIQLSATWRDKANGYGWWVIFPRRGKTGMPQFTRYVYKPYGELNMALSNSDLDGDGNYYESIYKYTGQEFDYDLGIYNYNARNYDQMTGRFIETDPVYTEREGFDAHDAYGYVYSNPVNFRDPTGAYASWDSNKKEFQRELDRQKKHLKKSMNDLTDNLKAYAIFAKTALMFPSYLRGGLKDSRSNKLDWNEERAREYRDYDFNIVLPLSIALGLFLIPGGQGIGVQIFQFLGAVGISSYFGKAADELRHYNPPQRKNLAHKGPGSKFMSMIDYNYDGEVDLLEFVIAFKTGMPRSEMYLTRDGRKVDMARFITYGLSLKK